MAASALLNPESRCQERYLTDQVAVYRRYAELVRREMDIKQSQVKKRYYQVFVKPNARRQQSRAHEQEAAPMSQLLQAEAVRTRPSAVGASARRPQPPQCRRGAVDTTQQLTASLPSFVAPSRKAHLLSQSAAAAADPLSSRVSALSLYTITARSRLRATRSTSRRGRRCGRGNRDGCEDDDDDDSDGGGSVASASDFPTLVYCIRRRLAKEASQQRRLAARNTALRRAQSAALEQNPLFAEEQCWRKGADGVIRRRAITNHLTSRPGAATVVDEAANVARPGAVDAGRGGRVQISREGGTGGAVTFLTELPRLPTAAAAAVAPRRPQQSRRDRLGARAACEPLWPPISSLA